MNAAPGALIALWLVAQLMSAGAALAQTPYVAAPPPEPGIGVCAGGLCQPEALIPVFKALREPEISDDGVPVHILQIGDSHTAGDRITGKLRADLQARFGAGGRGVLPPGAPYAGYAPYQVQVTAAGWTTEVAPLAASGATPLGAFGAAGVRGRLAAGDVLDLRFDPRSEPAWLVVCGWPEGPGAGLMVELDAEARTVDLNTAGDGGAACVSLPQFERAVSTIRLRGIGAGVTLSSVLTARDGSDLKVSEAWTARVRPGVVVSNLGVIGSTLADFASRDEAMVAAELGVWAPKLIVLAFGTNDGFDDGLDGAAYETLLRGQIARLRRLSPGAALMLLGAPDALRGGVTPGSGGGCSADGMRAPPPKLAVVRDVQRRVAADLGVALWDWHGRMGGDCSADRLALGAEPLMRGDRVHFTSAGADWIGGILSGDLLAAYDEWKAEHSVGPGSAE